MRNEAGASRPAGPRSRPAGRHRTPFRLAVGLIPGIGPVLAGGALMGILGGAVIGATAGGVLGGLAGMGIPEEEAQYYSSEFQAGRHLVTVRANGGYDEAREILSRRGPTTSRPGANPSRPCP